LNNPNSSGKTLPILLYGKKNGRKFWNFTKPEIKWFCGASLNIAENALDRHLDERGNKTAIIWEANEPDEPSRTLSYKELNTEVCRFANVLKKQGVKKGDRVCIYMPMVPELVVAVLACARAGAVHSVVFAGFSSRALADRITDAGANMVITADGFFRGKKNVLLKEITDEALNDCPFVLKTIVYKRTGQPVSWNPARDLWWHDEIKDASSDFSAEEMDAEDPLFILYTSGSTGKPKGIMHTCGGYMVFAEYSFRNVFQYEENDIYWCTADIGWITGHSYIVYGPLLAGATTVMFEGIPTYPDAGRFWDVVDKYKVNIFYTAPTAIRSLQSFGEAFVNSRNLSSLKTLGTVGEPINEEAWHWYDEHVGKKRCPIVDTWWQTETGGILISPLAGITETKPGFATLPLPGIQPCLMDEKGNEITETKGEGRLCFKFPWPSIARTIWSNHERYRQTYFSTFPDKYFTGDGCRRDADGYYRITGRVDDIIIVSGHNLGTAEIENAIDEHESVCETAVVGYPHAIKGNAIYAYVILFDGVNTAPDELRKEINELVTKTIGAIARPEKIQFVRGLPKTRSGKIMRRILRKIAENDTGNLGDTSTLLDPSVVDDIKTGALV
jgi:acetyl-CoA synthetase